MKSPNITGGEKKKKETKMWGLAKKIQLFDYTKFKTNNDPIMHPNFNNLEHHNFNTTEHFQHREEKKKKFYKLYRYIPA